MRSVESPCGAREANVYLEERHGGVMNTVKKLLLKRKAMENGSGQWFLSGSDQRPPLHLRTLLIIGYELLFLMWSLHCASRMMA